jgi:hypothetical protein
MADVAIVFSDSTRLYWVSMDAEKVKCVGATTPGCRVHPTPGFCRVSRGLEKSDEGDVSDWGTAFSPVFVGNLADTPE